MDVGGTGERPWEEICPWTESGTSSSKAISSSASGHIVQVLPLLVFFLDIIIDIGVLVFFFFWSTKSHVYLLRRTEWLLITIAGGVRRQLR